jgi:hypothetical protein
LVLSPPKFLPACYLSPSQTLLFSSRDSCHQSLGVSISTLNGNKVEVLYPMYWCRLEKFVVHTVLCKLSYKNIYFDFRSHETNQNSGIQLQRRLKRFTASCNRFRRSKRTFICNVHSSQTVVERRARPTINVRVRREEGT